MVRRLALGGAAAVLLVAGVLPLAAMVLRSVVVDGRLTLASYRPVLHPPQGFGLLAHSLTLATWTTLLATAIGTPLGILLERTDLPGRRLLTLLFTLPLALPPFILAVGWDHALAAAPSSVASARGMLHGLPGCVLVLTTVFAPLVMLLTRASLAGVPVRLEEAARLHAPWLAVWRSVTLPLILPAVGFAALLVFLLSLGELSVPMYLRFDVYPLESFTQFAASYDFGAATASAVPLAAVALLVLAGERLLRLPCAPPRSVAVRREGLRVEMGRFRLPAVVLASALASMLVVTPTVGLTIEAASARAYGEALWRAGGSLARGLAYAACGATALTVVGFFLGYAAHARALAGAGILDAIALVLFATPGTVLGIGLISLWNRPGLPVYGSPIVLIVAYVAQYAALTSRATQAALAAVPASMEEAARVAGAGWLRRMLGVVVPLTRPGLAAAWLLAYLFCLRDCGVALLVCPPGLEPLTVRTLTLMANGSPDLVAALCVLMIAAALLPVTLLFLADSGALRVGAASAFRIARWPGKESLHARPRP